MTEAALPSPRDWLDGWPFPVPPASSLEDGEVLRGCYCVLSAQLARTRNAEPYLRLTLADRHGPLEARLWENAEALADCFRPGAYVGVHGPVERYQGQLQLCIEAATPLRVGLEDLEIFLPRSGRTAEDMAAELEDLIASVNHPGLHRLLRLLLGPDSAVGQGFRLAPAAKFNHHAFLGGLLEHTLSVSTVCDRLAAHYGAPVDRDLLVAAALLHDVGKVREIGARAGFPYTDEGKLLGHILLGIQMVAAAAAQVPELEPGTLLLLQHLIASHQGRYEWQSPREPCLLEGLILHYADDLDAKLQQVRQLLLQGEGPWTAYDRSFRREFLRHLPARGAAAPEASVRRTPPADRAEAPVSVPERPSPVVEPAAPPAREPTGHPGSAAAFCSETLDLFADQEPD